MKKQIGFAFLSLVLGLALSSPAAAQPLGNSGGPFGAAGQVVITGELEAHLRSGWELHLQPSADYFIVPNVSVGGVIGYLHHSGNPALDVFNLGARAGYNLGINPVASFWPMVGISVSRQFGSGGSTTTDLTIFAPFLYHLVPHLFIGLGPQFDLALNGGGNTYGLQSVVGGWF
jgi:hypothetical protein